MLFVVLAAVASARTLTFSNGEGAAVVVQVVGDSTTDYVVPASATITFPVEDNAASFAVSDYGSGAPLVASTALPADSGRDLVITTHGEVDVLQVSPPRVHVENPTQGMEFVLFALGFLCAAVSWRFILGRW